MLYRYMYWRTSDPKIKVSELAFHNFDRSLVDPTSYIDYVSSSTHSRANLKLYYCRILSSTY